MGTDREMDADRVKQRGCEGAGQARDRQTEGDWDQAWREDAGMIVEREQNSQPDALKAEMLASDGMSRWFGCYKTGQRKARSLDRVFLCPEK